MQTSYFFFRSLVPRLSELILGSTLVSCFSQEKDELLLEFNDRYKSVFLRIIFTPSLAIIVFPDNFKRTRKNSADLFPSALMGKVVNVELVKNDRTIIVRLDNGFNLALKMYGSSGNVLMTSANVIDAFRKSMKSNDRLLDFSGDREIDWSEKFFKSNFDNIKKLYFTFGKEVWWWLHLNEWETLPLSGKFELVVKCLKFLDAGKFFLCRNHSGYFFSLLPFPDSKILESDPLKAINEFYRVFVIDSALSNLRSELFRIQDGKIKQCQLLIQKMESRLYEINHDNHFKIWADLIMANLHLIRTGDTFFRAVGFEDRSKVYEIRLRPDYTPQKNAENYYRKARNRVQEISRIEESLKEASARLGLAINLKIRVSNSTHLAELRDLEKEVKAGLKKSDSKTRLPYKEIEFMGFRILVGRSSTDNEELTFRVASKEDLWFHVRDAAGSHVIVRYQSGKQFPRTVIQRAASLAAYNSKRKGDSLCPVSYTKRKFVRKRKGDPAGSVVVDREEVIMVVPEQ